MYNTKVINLNGNRKLINACKKAELKTFNPQGKYNGFGYEKLPLAVEINSDAELQKFNKIKEKLQFEPVKKIKTEEEIIKQWAKRLSKLSGMDIEEAGKIAKEKIDYKNKKIEEVEKRQFEHYSEKREKLINKMIKENPLRRIDNEEHAQAIIAASHRHNNSDYEYKLEEGRELAQIGKIQKNEVREYARKNLEY